MYVLDAQHPSYIHLAAIFGRYKILEHLIEYADSGASEEYRFRLFQLTLQLFKGMTCIDGSHTKLSFKMCGVDQKTRGRCVDAVCKLADMAVKYFERLTTEENKLLL